MIKFDGSEYHLSNGLLHNLWGPAKIVSVEGVFGDGLSRRFFINGEIVWSTETGNHCRNMKEFKDTIYFHEELTNKRSGRQKDGTLYRRKERIDYIHHYIDLQKLREKEIRKKKIERIKSTKG